MKIKSLKYVQFEGTDEEWRIDGCSLGDVNLLVGKNASGKSRTASVISALGNLVCGDTKLSFRSGDYAVEFDNKGKTIKYLLAYKNSGIYNETLIIDGTQRMNRTDGGKGRIWAEKEKKEIDFQVPVGELACVSRRDSVQHPYFEDLYQWGKSVRFYPFGSTLGKTKYLADLPIESEVPVNLKNPEGVARLFRQGLLELGDSFVAAVKSDMERIGYKLDDVTLGSPESISIEQKLQCLIVKERELLCKTDQASMSQGMFRAFALIIHLTYAELTNQPGCLVIDDIGEGLDFERSVALINLIIEKAKRASVQLIMTTNDRFAMNAVDLKYWCVVSRQQKGCRIFNYRNSKEKFDEFDFTGLSNFDFFATGYSENSSIEK